jgi:hypothetical protein
MLLSGRNPPAELPPGKQLIIILRHDQDCFQQLHSESAMSTQTQRAARTDLHQVGAADEAGPAACHHCSNKHQAVASLTVSSADGPHAANAAIVVPCAILFHVNAVLRGSVVWLASAPVDVASSAAIWPAVCSCVLQVAEASPIQEPRGASSERLLRYLATIDFDQV